MAHKKAGGSVKNGRDSVGQRLGVKVGDGQLVPAGSIIVRQKLSDKVVADLQKPGKQRHVLEIYLPEPNQPATAPEPGVKVRWIVFAPNDTTKGATDVPATDPAWTKAKADADAPKGKADAPKKPRATKKDE